MLIERNRSCLLVVDIQDRLLPAIHEGERVIENTAWLMRIAQDLGVPLLVSEQYPRGLGHTVPALRELVEDQHVVEKIHFSCAASPECQERLQGLDRSQVLLVGVEAHVCVLQTALGLVSQGNEVFVVADGVSSRRPSDAEAGLNRMRAAGAQVVTREMVAFEWLHRAGTDEFREISRRFLR